MTTELAKLLPDYLDRVPHVPNGTHEKLTALMSRLRLEGNSSETVDEGYREEGDLTVYSAVLSDVDPDKVS